MRLALALAVLVLPTLGATGAVREVTSEAVLAPAQPMPACYRGYVYFIDGPDGAARAYAPDGHLAFTTTIRDEKTGPAYTQNLTVANEGTVAVSWIRGDADGRRAGIDLFDSSGRRTGSIGTGTYVPAHLAFGDDGALWTFGWQLHVGVAGATQPDYMTLRRFARDGKPTGAWLPRSAFPKGLDPAGGSWQLTRLSVTRDRVGVLATSGSIGSKQEWMELDLQGNLIGRWLFGDSNFARVSLTSDGRVYAQKGNGPGVTTFLTLDRAASTWRAVTPPSDDRFCGADGDKLVFAGWKLGPMRLRWFDQP